MYCDTTTKHKSSIIRIAAGGLNSAEDSLSGTGRAAQQPATATEKPYNPDDGGDSKPPGGALGLMTGAGKEACLQGDPVMSENSDPRCAQQQKFECDKFGIKQISHARQIEGSPSGSRVAPTQRAPSHQMSLLPSQSSQV